MSDTQMKRIIPIALAITVLAFSFACGPKPPDPMSPEARAARVENGLLPGIVIAGRPVETSSIAERLEAWKTPGVSVAVINDDRIEWAKGYGLTEAGSETGVTPNTLFQAASISKSVAAMAALRLVEQGQIALDEDVNLRLKAWQVPENDLTKTEKVTLRRLLSHTAGLTVHGFGGYAADQAVPTVVQVLEGQAPANSAAVRVDIIPGRLWRYSGGGFTVMQLLLSDVTGTPFPALLDELVLGPIGMRESTYEQPLPDGRRGEAATGHRRDGAPIPGRYHTYPEMAAAGLWTTPTDLALFLLEVKKAREGRSAVLTADTARLMTTVEKANYGLGLSLQGTGPSASFGHGGSNEGFKCQMLAFLEKGQGAVIMTNGDLGSRLAAEIMRAVSHEYDWPIFKPQEKSIVHVPEEALGALTGRYELGPGRTIDIVLEGGAVWAIAGDQRIELYPESETRFFELVNESSIEFTKGEDGKAAFLVIDGRIKAPRVGEN